MDEPNETPPGRLAEYLIGDLGIACRLLARALEGSLAPSRRTLIDIDASVQRCVRRIERDLRGKETGA